MLQSDLQGGSIAHNGADYPATIGAFTVEQRLRPDDGGFSPMLTGTATIAFADLGGITFKRGQFVTVTPSTGSPRACQIESVIDSGVLVQINLLDRNQNA
jgi:hypothetical protein